MMQMQNEKRRKKRYIEKRSNRMFGSTELLIIAAVIFVLFGAAAIPKFARSLGQAKSSFEKGIEEGKSEAKETKQS